MRQPTKRHLKLPVRKSSDTNQTTAMRSAIQKREGEKKTPPRPQLLMLNIQSAYSLKTSRVYQRLLLNKATTYRLLQLP